MSGGRVADEWWVTWHGREKQIPYGASTFLSNDLSKNSVTPCYHVEINVVISTCYSATRFVLVIASSTAVDYRRVTRTVSRRQAVEQALDRALAGSPTLFESKQTQVHPKLHLIKYLGVGLARPISTIDSIARVVMRLESRKKTSDLWRNLRRELATANRNVRTTSNHFRVK